MPLVGFTLRIIIREILMPERSKKCDVSKRCKSRLFWIFFNPKKKTKPLFIGLIECLSVRLSQPVLLFFPTPAALNCARLLTRVIPYMLEDPEWHSFFWSSLPASSENDSVPLAQSLINAVCVSYLASYNYYFFVRRNLRSTGFAYPLVFDVNYIL